MSGGITLRLGRHSALREKSICGGLNGYPPSVDKYTFIECKQVDVKNFKFIILGRVKIHHSAYRLISSHHLTEMYPSCDLLTLV